jgi:hypothetical protein
MPSATLTRPGAPPPASAPRGPQWLARLRALPLSTWACISFAALCIGALVGFFVFPTYPTYDSYYALIWGRDVLHLHMPNFRVYRAPTEHPLAIAFGVAMALFGQSGDRLMILGAIASFVALVAGLYRLGRLTFGPLVGALAAVVLCTRFDYEYYAAQGYLDFPYMALVVWAGAFEVARPRRGTLVFALLALAGLLRPDAWLLAGVYLLWCAWPPLRGWWRGVAPPPGTWSRLAGYTALTLAAPLLWAAVDAIVTGDPTYSLHSTTGLAEALGRTQGIANIPGSTWEFLVRLDKLPLVLGGIVGALLTIVLVPRRTRVPLALLLSGLLTFLLLGAAGTSVIDRYLLTPAVLVMLFAAVAAGGWSMLEPGTLLRHVWMVGAALLVAFAVAQALSTVSISGIESELAYRNDTHRALAQVLSNPQVRSDLRRCPTLSLPNHKLEPDTRWLLNEIPTRSNGLILARSQARAQADAGEPALREREQRAGIAIYPTGEAVFREALVENSDNPLDQVPLRGFKLILSTQYYAVYARCP